MSTCVCESTMKHARIMRRACTIILKMVYVNMAFNFKTYLTVDSIQEITVDFIQERPEIKTNVNY